MNTQCPVLASVGVMGGGGDQIVTYKLHLLNLNSFFPFPSALLFTGL